jgi:UDP-N-acetylglucosamine transferase subunit ALG13
VTVGNAYEFNRLLKKIEKISQKINDEFIIQTGYSSYIPKNCKTFKFKKKDEFLKLMKKANIIVTHGGVGTIMESIRLKKPTVVVPRRKKFNEHVNDHQLDITKELEEQGKIIPVYDIEDLESAIKKASNFKIKRGKYERTKIFSVINKKLKEWNKEFNENHTRPTEI